MNALLPFPISHQPTFADFVADDRASRELATLLAQTVSASASMRHDRTSAEVNEDAVADLLIALENLTAVIRDDKAACDQQLAAKLWAEFTRITGLAQGDVFLQINEEPHPPSHFMLDDIYLEDPASGRPALVIAGRKIQVDGTPGTVQDGFSIGDFSTLDCVNRPPHNACDAETSAGPAGPMDSWSDDQLIEALESACARPHPLFQNEHNPYTLTARRLCALVGATTDDALLLGRPAAEAIGLTCSFSRHGDLVLDWFNADGKVADEHAVAAAFSSRAPNRLVEIPIEVLATRGCERFTHLALSDADREECCQLRDLLAWAAPAVLRRFISRLSQRVQVAWQDGHMVACPPVQGEQAQVRVVLVRRAHAETANPVEALTGLDTQSLSFGITYDWRDCDETALSQWASWVGAVGGNAVDAERLTSRERWQLMGFYRQNDPALRAERIQAVRDVEELRLSVSSVDDRARQAA